ncbi:DUF885 family protein [Kitasatospora sp. NPDC056138]|uniref:DUF885 family protein n=1 Tax=Kitasatospora sp. NPDC056138 TaxID=3345724 RepID=UPI0035D5544E
MSGANAGHRTDLARLADDFWTWRSRQQPRTGDDIPRIRRPAGWTPDWSPEAVARYRSELPAFEAACRALADPGAPVGRQIDHLLLSSAIARVRWELEVLRPWQRDPGFYVDQSLGVVFDLLLPPPPFDRRRAADVLRQLAAVPQILAAAELNLAGHAVAEFARWTVRRTAGVGGRLTAAMAALVPFLPEREGRLLVPAAERAAQALEAFRDLLSAGAESMRPVVPLGPTAFRFFLGRVALLPFTPQELVALGRHEFDRAVTLELLERHRARNLPTPAPPPSVQEQIEQHRRDELGIRAFYREQRLLTQPAALRHYLVRQIPPYLAPLDWLGITDDLTSESRLHQDAVRYVPPPSPDLPYFDLAAASDPRLGIAHEGAHHQQLARSWANPALSRRRYYDSAPNEGIALYNEELLLATGLYDDAPHSRARVRNFLRLRALRVEVDVRLAIGDLTIASASRLLQEQTPMDRATADHEAVYFASTPGQALSYQAGKTQVLGFVADAARRDGTAFELRSCHDYLWENGNVPLSLLRWEYLGDRSALDRALALADGTSTP